MGFFDRLKGGKNKEPVTIGSSVLKDIGDGTLIALRYAFQPGRQPRQATVIPPETFDSFISKDGKLAAGPVPGFIEIGDYSDGGKSQVGIFSVSPFPFSIELPLSVKSDGGEIPLTAQIDMQPVFEPYERFETLFDAACRKSADGTCIQEYVTDRDIAGYIGARLADRIGSVISGMLDSLGPAESGDVIYDNLGKITEEIGDQLRGWDYLEGLGLRVRLVSIYAGAE